MPQLGIIDAIMDVTTRLFQASDLPALYAIEAACFEPPVRFSRSLLRSLAVHSAYRVWMALAGHVPAGFAILGPDSEESNAAYIWTIEVLPDFRRKGIAKQLLLRLEESARELQSPCIELHVSERNTDAQRLYEQAGYTRIAVESKYYSRNEDAWSYRKSLEATESRLSEL